MTGMHPKKGNSWGFCITKISVLLAIVITFLFTASAFATALARVNDVPIHDDEIKTRVQSYLRQIGHKRLSPVRMASLEKEVLKKLIEEELLYQEGLNADLLVTAQEIVAGVEKIRQRFVSQKAYDQALLKEGLSLDDIENGVSRSILIQKTWQRLSQMDAVVRENRVREMTQQADIQIFEAQVSTVAEGR